MAWLIERIEINECIANLVSSILNLLFIQLNAFENRFYMHFQIIHICNALVDQFDFPLNEEVVVSLDSYS